MNENPQEEEVLRAVTLQNATSIFRARQREEEELLRAQEALRKQSEWLRVTLASIGDAVVTTDTQGNVLSLNAVAEGLTGWTQAEAHGRPLAEVFRIINEESRRTVESPVAQALREGRVIGLANHTLLIARDGTETPIDDSAAPIRGDDGKIHGVVLVFRSILERKEAERALIERERELSDFFENASVGLHWVGPDGTILRVNRAELELLGYSREEYLGRHIAEFHVDPDVIADILRRLSAGETLHGYEARMRCKSGEVKHVLIDSSVLWKDGKFIHTRCFTRDITDRKRGDEANARLAAIVESSHDAILSKTVDGVIRSWNAGAREMFGYEAHETIGQSVLMLIPPERHDEEQMILDRLKRGDRVKDYETVRITKDGRRIDVDLSVSPLRDPAGVITGASKIARDITARKRAEQTTRFLADASAELAELTDYESTLQRLAALAVPRFADWCAVDIQDPDGSVRRLAVMHVDPARIQLIHDLDRKYAPRPEEARGARHVIRTGQPEWAATITDEMLEPFVHDDEHRRIIRDLGLKSYIAVPLKSRSGVVGALTFVMAESGRVYTPEDVHAAEDLARRAVIAIENAAFLAALRESDQRKDEFLAMLAHELRNPLTPIRNAVQIFRARAPAIPELDWATDVVDRQLTQLTRLVDDLLDVSRITRGRIELRPELVDLAEIVNVAVEGSRPLIERWNHQLSIALPSDLPRLRLDATRMAQVLMNLLNNAAKYTDPGGRIALAVEVQGANVEISVRDNGIGIPDEMLPRVFDMFAQVDRSLERSEGGLGIGLTLVKRLVEMHGGTVEARTLRPNHGTEFLVRLPRPAPEATANVSPAPDTPAAPSKRRILVVDDNRDAADSLGMVLRMAGNEIQTAHDGLEAVGAAATFRPEVILLDIGLPKLNGYDAARRIRELPGGDQILMIALTGWGQEEDRQRSWEAGFNHHMTKPVEFSALQKLLSRPDA